MGEGPGPSKEKRSVAVAGGGFASQQALVSPDLKRSARHLLYQLILLLNKYTSIRKERSPQDNHAVLPTGQQSEHLQKHSHVDF
ncbi:MAG: hypothetical protein ACK5O7_06425 [Holosporales bacterium]